jgi:hypothetical protein
MLQQAASPSDEARETRAKTEGLNEFSYLSGIAVHPTKMHTPHMPFWQD